VDFISPHPTVPEPDSFPTCVLSTAQGEGQRAREQKDKRDRATGRSARLLTTRIGQELAAVRASGVRATTKQTPPAPARIAHGCQLPSKAETSERGAASMGESAMDSKSCGFAQRRWTFGRNRAVRARYDTAARQQSLRITGAARGSARPTSEIDKTSPSSAPSHLRIPVIGIAIGGCHRRLRADANHPNMAGAA